jgi:ketosteroid isomerase-like protein
MSQENVEIVRALYEAWNAGDMDALRELYDPDVHLVPGKGWHEPRPYVGRDEVMRLLVQVREAWKSDSFLFLGARLIPPPYDEPF